MLDDELIRKHFDASTLAGIADAFKILHECGIFQIHVIANSSRIAESFMDKDETQLAKEILQVQQTNRQLLALHEFTGQFKKES